MRKSTSLTLNSQSKYNPATQKWTVYVPNTQIWYMLRLLEDKLFKFNNSVSHNAVTDDTFVFFMQIYLYEQVVKHLRSAAQSNKNVLKLNKTEAKALAKLGENCNAYLNKII
ncbi:hypothetical protein ACE193_18370 [Bernardetia sp. OM2101]|uniref:hypothetical protein n=1 Tax=Bernardetia sp. OM2101 TaxID=3344876 RepID=UPI0035D0CF89